MKRVSVLIYLILLAFFSQGCRNCFESISSSCLESFLSSISNSIFDPFDVESSVDSVIFKENINSIGIIIFEDEIFGWKFIDSVQMAIIEEGIEQNIYYLNPYLRVECSTIMDTINHYNLKVEYEAFLEEYDDEEKIDYNFVKKIEDLVEVECLMIVEMENIFIVTEINDYVNNETKPGYTNGRINVYLFSSNSKKLLWKASVYHEVDYDVSKTNLARELIVPALEKLFDKFPL